MQPEELYRLLRRSWSRFSFWRSEEDFLDLLRKQEEKYTVHLYIQHMHRKEPKSYLDMLKRSWPLSQIYLVKHDKEWRALYANGDTSTGRYRHNYFIDHLLREQIEMPTTILVENKNKLLATHQFERYAYLDADIGFNYDYVLGNDVRSLVKGKPHSKRKSKHATLMNYEIVFFDGNKEHVICDVTY